METSAKDNINVKDAFLTITKDVVKVLQLGNGGPPNARGRAKGQKLEQPAKKKKGGCC